MTRDQLIASILVSIIAGVSGWLAARQSSKAAVTNNQTSGRVEMEKEAYERARKLDTETIDRQDKELKELQDKYDKLKEQADSAYEQNQRLTNDVARMTHDNYQVHRENTRVIEINEQLLAENARLRKQGDILMRELNDLRERVLATFPIQKSLGDKPSPLSKEIQSGGE